MSRERAPRRYAPSAFPEIQGIRLEPGGASATLINLSVSGVLVESASRMVPGTSVTICFEGSFSLASIEGRVARCEVSGISADGSLRFYVAMAFSARITLAPDAESSSVKRAKESAAPANAPVLRNRW